MPYRTVLVGAEVSEIELRAAEDLAGDLEAVTGLDISIRNETESWGDGAILVGSPSSSSLIKDFHNRGLLGLKDLTGSSEGGSLDVVSVDEGEVLVLSGLDPMGVQYMVYDFCTGELGVDPCSYWTGYTPLVNKELDLTDIKPRLLPCPEIPIRCYFDNDNDELANMTKPYLEIDFPYWKEIVDTLLRLKFNAIDLHDHLGRTEYVTREPYLKLRPGYEPNIDLVNQIIDYAHSRGMKIQVSFYLGWSFRSISDEAAHNWRDNKEEWLDIWRYYLKETPIGKSDIFLNRPRDQKLDHPFRSSNGETVDQVFNEAFPLMNEIIREHNPQAVVIVDLYSEGRQAYRDGFRPEPVDDYILSWPDKGFGAFDGPLEDLKPYKSGIYMHAGFWRNHLVVDPYVDLLERSMKKAMYEYDMRNYCLVNGQTFRHFLLNLEACARISWYGESFSAEDFQNEWISRYFGKGDGEMIRNLLRLLHLAQENERGYVHILGYISNWQKTDLSERRCDGEWELIRREVKLGLDYLNRGLARIRAGENRVDDRQDYFHDHFCIPFTLLAQINEILLALLEVPGSDDPAAAQNRANRLIDEHTAFREEGDRNRRWKGWYDPATARPNGGYPRKETIQEEQK